MVKQQQIIITTCLRPTLDVMNRLEQLVQSERLLQFKFVVRKKQSIQSLLEQYQLPVLVVDKQQLEYHSSASKSPFFFHPSSAVFRIKQFDACGQDPLITAARLQKGMTVLDCTLGLGADAIVISHAVGRQGRVTGLESKQTTALIVREGLKRWKEKYDPIVEAMRRIDVQCVDHLEYLKDCPDNSIDVIYFDPMFEKTISESTHLEGLRNLANYEPLSDPVIEEARRVARQRIVLKAHFESELFEKFGFARVRRKSSKLHYGVIELEKKSASSTVKSSD